MQRPCFAFLVGASVLLSAGLLGVVGCDEEPEGAAKPIATVPSLDEERVRELLRADEERVRELMRPGEEPAREIDDGARRAATDCDYGSRACSPCVADAVTRLNYPQLDTSRRNTTFSMKVERRLWSFRWKHHNQGIARLANITRDGQQIARMALLTNIWDEGLMYAEGSVPENESARIDLGRGGRAEIRRTYDHPSGGQAHGDTLVAAMEDGPSEQPAGILFAEFSRRRGDRPTRLQRPIGRGRNGVPEDFAEEHTRAASAAFLKLDSGAYLVAVAGADHGKQGIWFYESAGMEDRIRPDLRLDFVGFWKPPVCEVSGMQEELGLCFLGASGMSLIAGCDGRIILATFHGSDSTDVRREEYQWIQLYEVGLLSEGGVGLVFLGGQADGVGRRHNNNADFRYAGSLYVDEGGNPSAYNVERGTNVSRNRWVDGNVYRGGMP